MTRKDYKLIADVFFFSKPKLSGAANNKWRGIIDSMSDMLSRDNPNFKPEKFKEACGVKSWQQ